jgi:hypothetical protein
MNVERDLSASSQGRVRRANDRNFATEIQNEQEVGAAARPVERSTCFAVVRYLLLDMCHEG